jgi:peptidoglycan glycosyltransferase
MALLLILAGGGYVAVRWRVGALIVRSQEAVIGGRVEDARAALIAAEFYRVRRAQVLEARAVVALAEGKPVQAAADLRRAREAGVRWSALDLDPIAGYLADTARYEALDLLAEHRQEAGGEVIAALWRAEAALALDRLESGAALLDQVPAGARSSRHARLQELAERRRRDGRAYSLFDRQDRPVYGRDLSGSGPLVEVAELGGALGGPGGLLEKLETRALLGRVRLTLDLAYQRAAHAALGRYGGSFVALDPRTGAILALVNHRLEEDGPPVHRRHFEPGSILKMVTLVGAVESGLDPDSLFPLNCTGNMTLDGKLFYDWTVHGTVADINEATSVSCNLAFAAMGLEMGQARLDDALHAFGFDRMLPASDLDLELGQLLDIASEAPRLGLARRAVGLENVTITPLHTALLAAVFAHGGTAMRPHLVTSLSSLGGESPYRSTTPEPLFTAAETATAELVSAAMAQVVASESGTGRRAAVPGLEFAMKTGTAGERRAGLNSIVFGYAPLGDPEVAFGFVALHAGKAELEGARIVRDFLTTVRNEFGRTP